MIYISLFMDDPRLRRVSFFFSLSHHQFYLIVQPHSPFSITYRCTYIPLFHGSSVTYKHQAEYCFFYAFLRPAGASFIDCQPRIAFIV